MKQNIFQLHILLVCDSDEVIPEETASAHTSSTSEGKNESRRKDVPHHFTQFQGMSQMTEMV